MKGKLIILKNEDKGTVKKLNKDKNKTRLLVGKNIKKIIPWRKK